jgi:hypothetical protein
MVTLRQMEGQMEGGRGRVRLAVEIEVVLCEV